MKTECKSVQKTGEMGVGWSDWMKADVDGKWVGVGGNVWCWIILVKYGLQFEEIGRFGSDLVNISSSGSELDQVRVGRYWLISIKIE